MGKSSKRSRAGNNGASSSHQPHHQNNGSALAATNGHHRPAADARQHHQQQQQHQFVSPQAQRAANIGSTLIHFGIVWLVVGILVRVGSDYRDRLVAGDGRAVNGTAGTAGGSQSFAAAVGAATGSSVPSPPASSWGGYEIPSDMVGPMPSYPNPLGITDDMRTKFHPVVVFPTVWADVADEGEDEGGVDSGSSIDDDKKKKKNARRRREKVASYQVLDHTQTAGSSQIVQESEWAERIRERKRSGTKPSYAVGRYDENRASMYSSDLFADESNDNVDDGGGYAASSGGGGGRRTVHIGIDLDGPVGTKVHAFTDGVVHSAGHNPDLGDYGHVIVVEHSLPPPPLPSESDEGEGGGAPSRDPRKVWALYGHLDKKSIRGKAPGKRIKKGQVLGRIGDIDENGGWSAPHVHFQLSTNPPETHDMPGVVSLADRPRALVEYPDPRLVLGPLY